MPSGEDSRPSGKVKPSSVWRAYSYAWITLGFFIISLVGHWVFGWFAYLDEQRALGQPPEFGGYLIEMGRDTLENWQSEFLQLLWQVGGLAFLLFVGSPQSKEGTDRMEAKIDALLTLVDPQKGQEAIRELDLQYDGRHTDEPHAQRN
ncbi:MAG: hypothetical protein E5Y88_25455 [Mesorhizobium sp.]|uniref:DUF6766 family protein n=1 Tax=unclassified Mesorhizobium TaxID=325217 RepID=UPI000F761B55|nr:MULTISPECIES: DUF6766 family protein [unclassified Mesorhizobium]AZO66512.1 hypothetical protein EJ075_17415 [Mesorhizobium sp. M6A.T.Cr.TU.016.01.1.1]RUU26306.1 hypothetical protein EOC94_27840 [Mesorhizobium sp. M6A.T.Ce.TU.016.01.1.1]RUV02233.1 hypothetical protein EOB36_10620 [Mesorhizobium sp. M6A.T.Cr.TU.017.01.1.1]RWN63698.1 MAG: hypothetical protein EOR99_26940 [Mesorhizobium sp.]RWO95466.1 MAG: hypothetical protein EOQ98_26080 [Mesorhizobium sp.]